MNIWRPSAYFNISIFAIDPCSYLCVVEHCPEQLKPRVYYLFRLYFLYKIS